MTLDTRAPRTTDLLYLYAILPEGSEATALLAEGRVPGVEPEKPLFGIEADALIAAVSHVSQAAFGEGPLNEMLQHVDQLAPYALRHNEAISALQTAAAALIPMSMGTVYLDSGRVTMLLRSRGLEFQGLLGKLHGTAEWDLKVYKDPALLIDAVDKLSDRLRELRTQAEQGGPGRAYLLRKQQERLREAEAARIANEVLDDILAALASVSAQHRIDALPPERPGESPLGLKSAFLVQRDHVDAFHSKVREIEQRHSEAGFTLEVTGPWPPYSFVGGLRGAA